MSARAMTDTEAASLVARLVDYMQRHSLKLVTAESCTAGLIASKVAEVEGAGQLLECAFVTYSPEAKIRCIGVRPETLAHHNLTSETVAREMAVGALARSAANVAIANTGVTDDIDPEVPAGTQCFAWAFVNALGHQRVHSETVRFQGDRNAIRQQSAEHALARLSSLHGQGG